MPVKDGPGGYGGRRWSSPSWVKDVPFQAVAELDLDLVVFQSRENLDHDQYETLSDAQRQLPRIYLEHNVPRPHAVDTRHPVDDPTTLLVHVTHFNRLMWDNAGTPTVVIEHSVAIDPAVRYDGTMPRGITVMNGMQARPRIAGYDLFLEARQQVPLDAAGIAQSPSVDWAISPIGICTRVWRSTASSLARYGTPACRSRWWKG